MILDSIEVVNWLHDTWGPAYWGWCHYKDAENNTEGIMLHVPPYFYLDSKRIYTDTTQDYFNSIRIPVPKRGVTFMFDFSEVQAYEWSQEDNSFEAVSDHFKKELLDQPKYFYLLEEFYYGRVSQEALSEKLGSVVSFMNYELVDDTLIDLNSLG